MRNGVPVTNGDLRHHGFGTKSIVAIVHKYGGTISFQAKGGVFNLNMLFTLRGKRSTSASCSSLELSFQKPPLNWFSGHLFHIIGLRAGNF